jgi:kanamycin kinase
VPAGVAAMAGGRAMTLVWQNEAGGLTFEVAAGDGAGRRFIKWAPAGSVLDLAAEAARMTWARQFHPVPQVLDRGADVTGSWLVTAALPGDNAVTDRWTSEPATAVTAIGEGLRALHEALPVTDCPFSWGAEERVADAPPGGRRPAGRRRLARVPPGAWHHRGAGTRRLDPGDRQARGLPR